MNLLIDENLPVSLGAGCTQNVFHATQLGKRLSDSELWQEAIKRSCILVTKDTDFFERILLHGSPPKVVWMRTGNMRRKDIEQLFLKHWPAINVLIQTADLIEVFEDRVESLSFTPLQ